MSGALDANKQRLNKLRNMVHGKNREKTSDITQPIKKQIERRQWSVQKMKNIHIQGTTIPIQQKFDIEIQCILETKSLDSKLNKQSENNQGQIDLLQPKQIKKKKDQIIKDEPMIKIKQMNQQELDQVVKSKMFQEFFNTSSKYVQKIINHGQADMIEMLLMEGVKSKDKMDDILMKSVCLSDANYTVNRVVTDFDWSPQIPELFLASYSRNEEGSIKDHLGLILLWNPTLKQRPQFYCFSQSVITSSKFYPFSNSTVIGGCYNGQLLVWDIRAKTMPIQRSGISVDTHKYPINSLNVIGTQVTNNVVSVSNEMMCVWDIKKFSKPLNSIKMMVPNHHKSNIKDMSTGLKKQDQPIQISVTCCEFPQGDNNNYYIGSLNGSMYKNVLHKKQSESISYYEGHGGPISAISINNCPDQQTLNGLVLTSSFDWTVKLWSGSHSNSNNKKQPITTLQSSDDYIYDVCWNPSNPTLLATVNNEGYIDLFDLCYDLQVPITRHKINNHSQNCCKWNNDGSCIISGDSTGNINLMILAEKKRNLDNNNLHKLETIIKDNKDQY